MKLIKMHGTGNDFLFVRLMDKKANQEFESLKGGLSRKEFVAKVCDRHFGVGADGVAFLEPPTHEDCDFRWDFYNSDGSSAEMCGNAARCVAKLYSEDSGQNQFRFQTIHGPIQAEVNSVDLVTISTSSIDVLKPQFDFASTHLSSAWKVHLIDSGVPHAVVAIAANEDLTTETNRKVCSELRSSEQVGPRGANVTLYKDISDDKIQSVSFERGVEDFTLACGTGVIAASFVKSKASGNKQIRVTVPGGNLEVDFSGESPKLSGPAVKVATVEIDNEYFKELK